VSYKLRNQIFILFALHPLHVESVTWVAERKDVLSTFWGMLSLLAYQHYVKQPRFFNYMLTIIFLSLSINFGKDPAFGTCGNIEHFNFYGRVQHRSCQITGSVFT